MKKLFLIAISLLAVFTTVGVAFSMWTQNVAVNGNVNSGSVTVALAQQYSDDPASVDGSVGALYSPTQLDPSEAGTWNQNADGSWYWQGNNWGKNVADIVCQENDPATNSMTITVNNGYPGYIGEIMVGVTNTGTIPVGIYNGFSLSASGTATIVNPVLNGIVYFVEPSNDSIDTGEGANVFQDFPSDAAYTITVTTVTPLNGVTLNQIDPGQTGWFIVDVNVMEAASQGSAYTFTLTASFANWNEVPAT